jgi:hypothetical protein
MAPVFGFYEAGAAVAFLVFSIWAANPHWHYHKAFYTYYGMHAPWMALHPGLFFPASIVLTALFTLLQFYFYQVTANAVGGPGPDSSQLIAGCVLLIFHLVCWRGFRMLTVDMKSPMKREHRAAFYAVLMILLWGSAGGLLWAMIAGQTGLWGVPLGLFCGYLALYLLPATVVACYMLRHEYHHGHHKRRDHFKDDYNVSLLPGGAAIAAAAAPTSPAAAAAAPASVAVPIRHSFV